MLFSNVYVLVYPNIDSIKIGKADDIFIREKQLKHWGEIDRDKSFFINVENKDVFKLESSLHFLLKNFKKEMSFADGYTEFFDIECYSKIFDLSALLGFETKKINFLKKNANRKYLSGNSMKLRRFENKIDKYSEYLNISNKNIQLLKKSIKIMKKIGYEFVLKNHDTNGLCLFIYSKAFIYKSFICGVMQLGQASSLTGEVKSSFVIPFSPDDKPAIMIDINVFQSFVYHSLNIGRIDYIHALLFCYNFLKKDLPNESELPVITLTKENKLVISS